MESIKQPSSTNFIQISKFMNLCIMYLLVNDGDATIQNALAISSILLLISRKKEEKKTLLQMKIGNASKRIVQFHGQNHFTA